jgi:homospermidine synthase
MQVAIGVVSGVMWMMENTSKGVCVPDDLPHEYILKVSKLYLGKWISKPADWTPLTHYANHFNGYNNPQIDPSDPWQFKNFLITDGD